MWRLYYLKRILTEERGMGRKRQKLHSDADDRASVYAGYQRRG